jgi:hypothetical protein
MLQVFLIIVGGPIGMLKRYDAADIALETATGDAGDVLLFLNAANAQPPTG